MPLHLHSIVLSQFSTCDILTTSARGLFFACNVRDVLEVISVLRVHGFSPPSPHGELRHSKSIDVHMSSRSVDSQHPDVIYLPGLYTA